MKLRTFYVKSYRSIVEATLDEIQQYCVIVGPNNAGKSNLLKAIYVSLSIALEGDFQRVRRNRQYAYAYRGEGYNWERDIPVSLRDDQNASTVFKLTFEFSEEEKLDFREKFGINLSKSLQMKFQLFERRTEYNIIMPGRAKKPMEEKIREIGLFIRSKLDYEYIPCVRSTDLTSEYFSRLLSKELYQIQNNPEYQKCIETIRQMQEPIIHGLEDKLTTSLRTFLPGIKCVSLEKSANFIETGVRFSLPRARMPIFIDDDSLTSIEDKGDGVKSLVAIGLIESMSYDNLQGRSLILCIEEPEAHLHPDAIHRLRNVLLDISSRVGMQVIISTHSPILVDREKVSNNIVIKDNHLVAPCKSIAEVRELLGVRVSDNLNASKIVLVEGESDRRYFEKLCREASAEIAEKLDSGYLSFENVHSAAKMDYQVRMYNSIAVSTLVILDSDSSGIESSQKLISGKIKPVSEVLLIKSAGMKHCELEDIVDMRVYVDLVKEKYNINLNTKEFKKRNKPWSDRLHNAADKSPGVFDSTIETNIKTDIADIVEELGIEAIAECDREFLNSMIEAIKNFAK